MTLAVQHLDGESVVVIDRSTQSHFHDEAVPFYSDPGIARSLRPHVTGRRSSLRTEIERGLAVVEGGLQPSRRRTPRSR